MSLDREMADRLGRVRERIAAACRRAGRDPAEVTLVGASKQQPLDRLAAAWRAGLRVFGENRVQEAATKAPALPLDCQWHLIGPLQSNKARVAAGLFHVVHSVDRPKIAEALAAEAEKLNRRLPCLLEINLGEEESKHGFLPEGLFEHLAFLGGLAALEIRGLMAIPPFGDVPEASRPWFVVLAQLRDRVASTGLLPDFRGELSMGMSEDFEVAIEEGATHVRVGTALFGPRTPRLDGEV
ncbi:MAG TPA: YggS family pyridoxal phosphate-dependent enzyme [Thermoanaerobaculia bacterium]|nr:YggS family pyridoxal phosphate-dependent enzyme [Thermoanaerobaculia bacterium]